MTRGFPEQELFALVNQMNRAVVSITSNIAEGFGRSGYKERIQFYYIAQGSLIELKNQLIIAKDIGYIDQEIFDGVFKQANTAHELLQGLIRKSKTFLKSYLVSHNS